MGDHHFRNNSTNQPNRHYTIRFKFGSEIPLARSTVAFQPPLPLKLVEYTHHTVCRRDARCDTLPTGGSTRITVGQPSIDNGGNRSPRARCVTSMGHAGRLNRCSRWLHCAAPSNEGHDTEQGSDRQAGTLQQRSHFSSPRARRRGRAGARHSHSSLSHRKGHRRGTDGPPPVNASIGEPSLSSPTRPEVVRMQGLEDLVARDGQP